MCVAGATAQVHRFGVGLSGGVHTMFADSNLVNTWGGAAGIDFRYTYLIPVEGGRWYVGPRVGLEANWAMAGWKTGTTEQFTNTDYLGHAMEYTVYAKAQETHHHVYLGIPVMAEFKYYGLVAGVGVKAKALLWTTSKTEITSSDISAYYPDFDITIENDPSIGIVTDNKVFGARVTPEWHIAVVGEIGYEWALTKLRYLGVRLFAEYNVWNSFERDIKASTRCINIAPIDVKGEVAKVSLTPIYDASLTKFNALTIGVTLTYTYDVHSKRHHCNCLPY